MSILLVVLAGIMTSLVSATTAQADLQSRFEAQESARLALSTFQRDVRCAVTVSPTSGATDSITLTLPTGCSTTTGPVTWCTVPNGPHFDLWRVPAAACTTGDAGSRRWTDNLTAQNVFTPDATVHAGAPVSPAVKLAITVQSRRTKYHLTTSVYSRNAVRQ